MPDSDTEHARRANSRFITRIAAVAWTLLILALCTVPGQELPDIQIVSADKAGHVVMFAGFGWLWMRSFPPSEAHRRFKHVLIAGIAYAVLTEVYQGIIPFGRVPDVWDAIANITGVLIGAGIHRILSRS